MKKVKSHGHGLLNFFDIVEDGLYTVQKNTSGGEILSESAGLSIQEVLPEIKAWLVGRAFKATCPWVDDQEGPNAVEMCYCQELFACPNGDYILILWKSDPSDTEGYRGLMLDESGKPSTYLNNSSDGTGDNVVWGHPCYYWIVPEKQLVVSLKFADSKCDNALFKKWINCVVRHRLQISDYISRTTTDKSVRVRFSIPSAPETYSYIYRFNTAIREFDTTKEYLEAVAANTKSIIFRDYVATCNASGAEAGADGFIESINYNVFEFFKKLVSMLDGTESGESDDYVGKRKIELLIEGTPSLEMVSELLSYNGASEGDEWRDVIFTTEDDENISFKTHRLVEHISMSRAGDPYTGTELYSALSSCRDHCLSRFSNVAGMFGDLSPDAPDVAIAPAVSI